MDRDECQRVFVVIADTETNAPVLDGLIFLDYDERALFCLLRGRRRMRSAFG